MIKNRNLCPFYNGTYFSRNYYQSLQSLTFPHGPLYGPVVCSRYDGYEALLGKEGIMFFRKSSYNVFSVPINCKIVINAIVGKCSLGIVGIIVKVGIRLYGLCRQSSY